MAPFSMPDLDQVKKTLSYLVPFRESYKKVVEKEREQAWSLFNTIPHHIYATHFIDERPCYYWPRSDDQNPKPYHTFKQEDQRACAFLQRCPREVRNQIYRELFKRSPGITPIDLVAVKKYGPNYNFTWNEETNMPMYDKKQRGYIWAETNGSSGHRGVYLHSAREEEEVEVTTVAMATQRQIIQSLKGLPITPGYHQNPGFHSIEAISRGEYGMQVVARYNVKERCIFGIELLRTCKIIHKECMEVLYGENTFVFPTGYHNGGSPDNFDDETQNIPWYLTRKARVRMANRLRGAERGHWSKLIRNRRDLNKLLSPAWTTPFEHEIPQGKLRNYFVASAKRDDAMLSFFGLIGAPGMMEIRKVQITGTWKTVPSQVPRQHSEKYPIGFGHILPLVGPILRVCLPKLQEVTLHSADKEIENIYRERAASADAMDTLTWGEPGLGSSERFDYKNQVVGDFVKELPFLRKLQLGGDESLNLRERGRYMDEWGSMTEWMDYVDKRRDAFDRTPQN